MKFVIRYFTKVAKGDISFAIDPFVHVSEGFVAGKCQAFKTDVVHKEKQI